MTDKPATPETDPRPPDPKIEGTTTPNGPEEGRSVVPEDPTGGDGQERASAEEFAKEHDPAEHDIAAGEELRQRGDWTADEAGAVQVWDAQGNLVEGTSPAEPVSSADKPDVTSDPATAGHRGDGHRTSSLDEVRDGGYSVGSAALIDDGATPLGHPVKAWEDSKTFITPEGDGYDDAQPDLWFTDAGAAQRAGFRVAN